MSMLDDRELTDTDHRSEPVHLSPPIGPLTEFTEAAIRHPGREATVEAILAANVADPLDDLDFQRALFALHQLHDRGVSSAHDEAEWEPATVAWWQCLARHFEAALLDRVDVPDVALGPTIPLIGAIARQSRPVSGRRGHGHGAWDGPMHRTEVRRHPLAHARVVAAAHAAGTCPPVATSLPVSLPPMDDIPVELLLACNLTSHLALHQRLLPALLGHLVWLELTSPADPCAGPTHATVADAYLDERVDERPLAVWGADVTAMVEARLARAVTA